MDMCFQEMQQLPRVFCFSCRLAAPVSLSTSSTATLGSKMMLLDIMSNLLGPGNTISSSARLVLVPPSCCSPSSCRRFLRSSLQQAEKDVQGSSHEQARDLEATPVRSNPQSIDINGQMYRSPSCTLELRSKAIMWQHSTSFVKNYAKEIYESILPGGTW